ncbi:MAG: transposase [Gemmatimonadaceae bacterium]|nr:transposase [Gemmatimonadaceae bacterium]
MSRRRRQVSREFKLEAVRLVQSGSPPAEVAREFGIRRDMLRKWRRQFAAATRPSEAFPGNGKLTSQDKELRQLRWRVAQLEEEREIRKKATAFFARESR